MTIEDLLQIEIMDVDLLAKLSLLLEAVSDWRTGIDTVEGYLQEVTLYLGRLDLSKQEVLKILTTKCIVRDAWKIESISTLIRIIEVSNNETIEKSLRALLLQISKLCFKPCSETFSDYFV